MRPATVLVWFMGASVVSGLPLATDRLSEMHASEPITLPAPRQDSGFSIERALLERRSMRTFHRAPLTREEISQLLWAAQGTTSGDGLRTAPSAGALFPLELYLITGGIGHLHAGTYRYLPARHALARLATGDARGDLAAAALGQECVADAAAVIAVTAVPARTTGKYGNRGLRYIHMEAGHAAQNVLLQATALGLGAVPIGAFDDAKVAEVLALPKGETPLYLIALGRP